MGGALAQAPLQLPRMRPPSVALIPAPPHHHLPPPMGCRYAMLVDDGTVVVANMEEGGAFTISGADDILAALG